MNIKRIHFLREFLVDEPKGHDHAVMEFSYDNGVGRAPHFFRAPDDDETQARALYLAWGGSRAAGFKVGTTASGPWIPYIQSKSIWRKNGNP